MSRQESTFEIGGHKLKLTNLGKVLFPETGFTKGQVIDYYAQVAPVLLPHLRDRPLTLKRYPNGVDHEFFYEKRAPKYRPKWLKTAEVPSETDPTGKIDFCLANDLASLIWAANLADLELHPFLAKKQDVQRPTQIVFDLDPGPPADATQCAEVALWIRDLLEKLGLKCWVKSSGSKGLQLHIPLNTPTTYAVTKPFAKALAQALQKAHPDRVVYDQKKTLRTGKVLIDWSQNDASKTTVCVYSLRAKSHPFVAAPLRWEEVEACYRKKDPRLVFFESDALLRRVKKQGDLFADVLTLKQKLPKDALARLDSLAADGTAPSTPLPKSRSRPAAVKSAPAVAKVEPVAETRRDLAPPPRVPPSEDELMRAYVEPMKCLPVKQVPGNDGWLYELKFDGYRALAICRKGAALLVSRNQKSFNLRFPTLVEALGRLPVKDAVLDGEIVALDENNRTSFQVLQNYQQGPLAYYAFDLLSLDGEDWTGRPLEQRKERLQALLKGGRAPLFFSGELPGKPAAIWQQIQKQRLEGLVAKRRDSRYEAGRRSGQWVKVKAINQQEFVIGGFTEPQSGREAFGALLVGVYEAGELRFCAKVGTGFDRALLHSLRDQMIKLKIDACPFSNLPVPRNSRWGGGITRSEMKLCTWIRPALVCEVQFTEWTGDNSLRHPAFLGLREDIGPETVVREKPVEHA